MVAMNGGGGAVAVNSTSLRFALFCGHVDGVTIAERTDGAR